MEISLPPSSGFTNYWDNVGEILNKGVEFSIKTHNMIVFLMDNRF